MKRKQHRPTHAVIDLAAYQSNLKAIQRCVGRERKIIAIIKSNAYGHGMLECAHAGWDIGIRWFGVATVDEALTLRRESRFDRGRILLLGPTFPADASALVSNNIDVAVGSLKVARALDRAAKKYDTIARAHLKVDTGMGRFGFWCKDVPPILQDLAALKSVEWVALMTHFSESDVSSREYTRLQLKNFAHVIKECKERGFKPCFIHAANSGGVLQHPDSFYDLVRPGIMTYGLYPDTQTRHTIELKPVLTLLTKIVEVREFPSRRYLSYGRTYQTRRRTKVGLLPLGYGDGYPRALSNKGYVIVRGKKAPVIGRVCMDQVLIDISRIPDAGVGDEVLVYGKKGRHHVPIEELAHTIGTISYELTCQLTPRVPRLYK